MIEDEAGYCSIAKTQFVVVGGGFELIEDDGLGGVSIQNLSSCAKVPSIR